MVYALTSVFLAHRFLLLHGLERTVLQIPAHKATRDCMLRIFDATTESWQSSVLGQATKGLCHVQAWLSCC
jgi:hypothetical protein